MTYVRLKGFKFYNDRHGRRRGYHRATGIAVDLVAFPLGTVEFLAECARIAGLYQPSTDKKVGTLGDLIKAYRASDEFCLLSKRTRADYNRCFNYLQPIDGTMLSAFTPPLVVKIRDKAAAKMGRKWGTYVKTCLSLVFSWGTERGHIASNPAFRIKGVKKPKDTPEANPPWSDEHRHAVLSDMPSSIAVEMSLMMFCGLDPGDVVKLPKTAIKDGKLNTRRQKTKEPVWVDLPQPLLDAILRRPLVGTSVDCLTFCHNTRGRQWATSGLDSAWLRYRNRLVSEGKLPADAVLTLKGLRHTVATILAEMGYDDRTIADMLGQKTLAMAQHYSKQANRSKKLTAVVKEFNAEIARRKAKVV